MEIGDYVFSIPKLYAWDDEPKPMRTAEVVSVTKTRAVLDNGVTVVRQPNSGGPYRNWVQTFGHASETFEFERYGTLVWVPRNKFAYATAFWGRRREVQLRALKLTEKLNKEIDACKSVEHLTSVETERIDPLFTLLS